ncbi:SRPBCC family protein [Bradyrhizobium sp. U87765 SZCCT0131]|uniref:SRPBCC family protein n=1 Tax=unclassified Bradyrhizobium TaxID=2631580 RepID=UPI001BA4C517|nr:SRPBCC family protein [Bradyrhizobium sp. U87765 SZCCT0131]MBR1260980.1 SRPBCC family protein [Bradyrhizobium sp. U87765 SZCCT0134]MBR1303572.1 SRPBCC family protein [Bradyrhizobium sp. U87765 SZCCT0110]MBR1319178.1 SRPBCC family protein [Bradyrhizobium sp. U87765 SZCCT0109]MBR1347503.1 SRPBCC family protein [Bradyrhizobium sp. U87765 SZCCT0048]
MDARASKTSSSAVGTGAHHDDESGPNRPSDFTLTLPSDRELLITRSFAAPRELVWMAVTDAAHVRRWWGCDDFETMVCEIDLRVGGRFRFEMRGADGTPHPITGVYREIVRPERLVHTQIYDVPPHNDKEAIVTVTFTEANGRTHYACLIAHATREDRDAHVASGVEGGVASALDRIEQMLLAAS